MRSPDHSHGAPHRAGREFEEELRLHYLSPGAFTILPPEHVPPPDPPTAPIPYRLTPTSRRNRNQAFSIIAESTTGGSGSRSSSPTGRVSPFRGRGFNPSGSRHASPNPSPPPEDVRLTPSRRPTVAVSRIPTLTRRGSHSAFGERVSHIASPRKRVFQSQLSQSLSSLEGSSGESRPPPASNPKKAGRNRNLAFQQLSPIAGSSPEPSQSLSSPRIPKSRSQPGSRITSPTRTDQSALGMGKPPTGSRIPSRTASTNISREPSRNVSREPSPNKNPTSPTRIPVNKYRNIQPKVNSYSSKPKVPPKPQVSSDESDIPKTKLVKKDSVKKSRTTSRSNLLAKTASNNNITTNVNNTNNNNNNNSNVDKINKTIVRHPNNKSSTNSNKTSNKKSNSSTNLTSNDETSDFPSTVGTNAESELSADEDVKTHDSVTKPSTTAVVSSTTTTATQPLKIDAKIEPASIKFDKPKAVSPMVDGRVLSATSVSNAINKMNDTVLNTQTVIKDHGFSKMSPAANAIVSMANESRPTNPALDTKNATSALPTLETGNAKPIGNNNHVTSVGILDSKNLEEHVQNTMNRINHVMSPDHVMGNSVQKSVNERIKDARTVVAEDVKPIKIVVQEKPSDVEVQSGNVRLPMSATNGLSERPGLPPTNQTPPNETENAKPPPKPNPCTRFFAGCRNKFPCKCCKKADEHAVEDDAEKTGCFNCRKKKKEPEDQVRINIEPNESEPEIKPKLLDRLKCCGRNKVGDTTTGCFSKSKRKESWAERRRDSILSDPPTPPKSKCKDFLRKLFCLNLCCKKKMSMEEQMSRKASVMSKKKSLTPTTMPPPPEENKNKLDMSLVEHTSHMKGAVPVLPVSLAWFCLVMNCLAPGTGTVFSGLFCLCLGIPRFSQKDGPKQRIGAFIINVFIGAGQFFTVLFCLVGWGWSIWWGVIMVKVAKKHRKIKHLEALEEQQQQAEQRSRVPSQNHNNRNGARGS